jgi:hypothetical protein
MTFIITSDEMGQAMGAVMMFSAVSVAPPANWQPSGYSG